MDLKMMLNSYLGGYAKIVSALNEFPKEMWDYKPAPEKWNIHEIIIHLADSEVNAYARCRKIIAESGTPITAYDQDLWAVKLNYQVQDTEKALELFKYLRETTYELLSLLPEETWNNYMLHPERGKVTLLEWLKIYEDHVPVHIEQMKRNLNDWNKKHTN